MSTEFSITRRVEFSETDLAGIMHFTNFYRWMEICEHEFLRSLGLSVDMVDENGRFGWPRVKAAKHRVALNKHIQCVTNYSKNCVLKKMVCNGN